MRDLFSNIGVVQALAPAVQSATAKGGAIDKSGYDAVAFIVGTGALAGSAVFGVKVQESDTTTDGDFTDADASVVDTDAPTSLAASSAYKLGYRGFKRYSRVVFTLGSGTSLVIGAFAILSHARVRPIA